MSLALLAAVTPTLAPLLLAAAQKEFPDAVAFVESVVKDLGGSAAVKADVQLAMQILANTKQLAYVFVVAAKNLGEESALAVIEQLFTNLEGGQSLEDAAASAFGGSAGLAVVAGMKADLDTVPAGLDALLASLDEDAVVATKGMLVHSDGDMNGTPDVPTSK